MTYRPPAISVALDLVDALYEAALDVKVAAFTYGRHDTATNQSNHAVADEALDVALEKLADHVRDMARGDDSHPFHASVTCRYCKATR